MPSTVNGAVTGSFVDRAIDEQDQSPRERAGIRRRHGSTLLSKERTILRSKATGQPFSVSTVGSRPVQSESERRPGKTSGSAAQVMTRM